MINRKVPAVLRLPSPSPHALQHPLLGVALWEIL